MLFKLVFSFKRVTQIFANLPDLHHPVVGDGTQEPGHLGVPVHIQNLAIISIMDEQEL